MLLPNFQSRFVSNFPKMMKWQKGLVKKSIVSTRIVHNRITLFTLSLIKCWNTKSDGDIWFKYVLWRRQNTKWNTQEYCETYQGIISFKGQSILNKISLHWISFAFHKQQIMQHMVTKNDETTKCLNNNVLLPWTEIENI